MRAVLDTNVVVSALFFGGVPRQLLEAWMEGRFELVLSPSIFDEYVEVCDRLAASHPRLEYREALATLIGHSTLVADPEIAEPITTDPDDDKFLACADASGATVVSGDSDLLEASGWKGIDVLTPRAFLTLLGTEDQ